MSKWLTDKKFYYDRLFKQMEKQIMAEAIDDFAEKLLSQQIVDKSVVRRVKEQLKAGVKK